MEYTKKGIPLFDREISWLSFNERVLQEAEDKTVPLINRLQFLAIFSSNLDEFYKVRVASVRHMIRVAKKASRKEKLLTLLHEINRKTVELQTRFGHVYRQELLPGLADNDIFLRSVGSLTPDEIKLVQDFFYDKVKDAIRVIPVSEDMFLKNEHLYHLARYPESGGVAYAIVPFPWDSGRFYVLPSDKHGMHILMMDDVLRIGMKDWLGQDTECWSFKLNRDAELYLHDELAKSVKEKIKKSLKKRRTGIPSRFLYDGNMPSDMLKLAKERFHLEEEDLVQGGRYHNYFDFWKFPYPENSGLAYPVFKALSYRHFDQAGVINDVVQRGDHLLHFPYQDYKYLIRFLDEAAVDPEVTSIKMTLYRAAKNSAIFKALKTAAQKGKEVILFNEVQARFDEENNMWIGEELEKSGARVLYSHEGLKVHSKVVLITRNIEGKINYQAALATGNFNEKTAKIYSDLAMFTASQNIGKELDSVFGYLENPAGTLELKHLLVAKHNMRQRFEQMIDREIANAQHHKPAEIFCKMNSLQDRKMIEKLYEASRNGVKIKLLVRGICCIVPGKEGWSDNIEVRSIVGRFLEHARLFMFNNNGNPEIYAGSADWMTRNLKRRVEVIFPVEKESLKKQLKTMMDLQWQDRKKSRCINELQDNPYCYNGSPEAIDSQHGFYNWLKSNTV